MAIIVNTLPAYVEEHRLPLISKAVIGAKSIDNVTIELGVKGDTALNLLDTTVVLQDASACGFNASGDSALSQRVIAPKRLKVNMEFCDKALAGKWAQYAVITAAGKKKLPFEEDFINGVINNVNAAVEKMIWQGDKSNANEFDGLINIIETDGGIQVSAKATVWDSIKAAYASVPAEVQGAEDLTTYVASDKFNALVQELVSANLYHYKETDAYGEIILPGTNMRVVSTAGLVGADSEIVIARKGNLFFGTDLLDDKETFDLWYSKDDQVFKLAIEFLGGTQVAYPSEVVYVK